MNASAVPTRKVGAGVLAGALSTLLLFILQTAMPDLQLPSTVGAAVTTLLTFVVSYFVPEE